MKQFRSIQLKFIFVFVGILFIACVAAMFAANGFARSSILRDMRGQITNTAQNIVTLSSMTSMSMEDIIDTVSNPYYSIHAYEPDSEALPESVDNASLSSLEENKLYFSSQTGSDFPFAIMNVHGSYVVMAPHADNNELVSFRSSGLTVLVFCAMIGAMLMLIAVTQILKPVTRLTRATQEVAKGNFDVTVDYDSCDELGQLTHHFNLMTQELKNMEYLRKDFVSSVSHEFKTPIASIQGFARLLKTKDLTQEEFDEYTDVIISESDRLSKLSSNLLRLSRLENQAILPAGSAFSLDEQIRKTILLLESEWSAKNLELEIDMEDMEYAGNEEMIQQIWINLLSNAIKFSNDGGTLWVRLKKESGFAVVEIADNGVGISAEALPRIFEKFYQGDVSRSAKGNGLGLSIVRQILDSCGGDIFVESELGNGAKFTVKLPIQEEKKKKPAKTS